jgi:Flp pilus assembly protein TadB
MCLIVTVIMFVLAIQNLMQSHWIIGGVQCIIALGFFILLLRNIQKARCDREVSCDNACMLTIWIAKIFPKKDH